MVSDNFDATIKQKSKFVTLIETNEVSSNIDTNDWHSMFFLEIHLNGPNILRKIEIKTIG